MGGLIVVAARRGQDERLNLVPILVTFRLEIVLVQSRRSFLRLSFVLWRRRGQDERLNLVPIPVTFRLEIVLSLE
jgi:hypothetical protein